VPEAIRLMSDDAHALREHFDTQLAAIRSLVEVSNANQNANHITMVAQVATISRDIGEVKNDVKTQNGRVGKIEIEQSYMKGQKSGSNGMFNALLAAFGAVLGAVGTAIAITQLGSP
jgi:hypothetical protein